MTRAPLLLLLTLACTRPEADDPSTSTTTAGTSTTTAGTSTSTTDATPTPAALDQIILGEHLEPIDRRPVFENLLIVLTA